jgi:hypothetical protein
MGFLAPPKEGVRKSRKSAKKVDFWPFEHKIGPESVSPDQKRLWKNGIWPKVDKKRPFSGFKLFLHLKREGARATLVLGSKTGSKPQKGQKSVKKAKTSFRGPQTRNHPPIFKKLEKTSTKTGGGCLCFLPPKREFLHNSVSTTKNMKTTLSCSLSIYLHLLEGGVSVLTPPNQQFKYDNDLISSLYFLLFLTGVRLIFYSIFTFFCRFLA